MLWPILIADRSFARHIIPFYNALVSVASSAVFYCFRKHKQCVKGQCGPP